MWCGIHAQIPACPAQGVAAQQYDAWDIGVTTNDCFGNADVVYPVTLPAVRTMLTRVRAERAHIPVVTGFLGRGQQTGGPRICCSHLTASLGLCLATVVTGDHAGTSAIRPFKCCGSAHEVECCNASASTWSASWAARDVHIAMVRSAGYGVHRRNNHAGTGWQ